MSALLGLGRHVAALRWLLYSREKRGASRRWLFRTHTRLFREFSRRHNIRVEDGEAGLTYVSLDGIPFVWPAKAHVEPLIHLLAEVTTPGHPHQYDYGLTKLGPNEVVLDIGCCDGGFAAKAAQGGAAIIAVEPSQTMAAVIHRLFELRALPPPQVKQCLLGARPGIAYFQENMEDPARSRIAAEAIPDSYPVIVTTVDALTDDLTDKPTYLKCDAEGADLEILKGGQKYLRERRPKVAVTSYHRSSDFTEIASYLRSLGYTVEGKGIMYVGGEFRVVMIHAAHLEVGSLTKG